MRHYPAIEFLPHQFRRLAAEDAAALHQMRLEFIKHQFHFPSLVIQRRQHGCGRQPFIVQRGQQAIHRFAVGYMRQRIVDDPHGNPVDPILAIAGVGNRGLSPVS
ncbi:MAG: hypothetical protein A3I66_04960 [Burkholderiales bacterium RIFCSPLOWO2_02_FULL_57_36]|nr:MAG: hypothetical protein A3I66_04960 [Burkholderiales bacterium RIFCSPLOWO2_02_FULL_57_36]